MMFGGTRLVLRTWGFGDRRRVVKWQSNNETQQSPTTISLAPLYTGCGTLWSAMPGRGAPSHLACAPAACH